MTEQHRPARSRPRSSISKQIREAYKRDGIDLPRHKKLSRQDLMVMPPLSLAQSKKEWDQYFVKKQMAAFPFQKLAWKSFEDGQSGIILSATGSGKTIASLGGPLMRLRSQGSDGKESSLCILYVSPLKALVKDVEKGVHSLLEDLGWGYRVETRTGDTLQSLRKKQADELPHILFTTPESLALLITHLEWKERFQGLFAIVIDEWHELIGSKRGSLLELTLAKIRGSVPRVVTWAVSATIADPLTAAQVAVGVSQKCHVIQGEAPRQITINTLLPQENEILPWFGFRGLSRLAEVAAELDVNKRTLIFTNTRGQAESWYSALSSLHPEWEEKMGLHHGSIDPGERERVESGIKDGTLSFVVATSSLDLGVDFPSVEKVIQIGSVKGVTRATQRAGRAFHQPEQPTELTVCPTHFMEYVEVAALRLALENGVAEERLAPSAPLDVLIQFVLSSGLGQGFLENELLREVRSAYSFRDVSDETFAWVIAFVTTGGHTLRAYSQYRKLIKREDGYYRFATPELARYHRMNIGTIVSDTTVRVKYLQGGFVGQIDEGFVSKLKPGDVFIFSGKTLQLISIRDLTAYVKLAKSKQTVATVWGGHALPISQTLSEPMRELLTQVMKVKNQIDLERLPLELQALYPSFEVQKKLSTIPLLGETLVERLTSREGYHLFVYTWGGRLVNEGLGHLVAYRLSQLGQITLAVSANDHGFECLASAPYPQFTENDVLTQVITSTDSLLSDIRHSHNFPELAKRCFREIARIAGLIQVGSPHERKTMRHLQMSSSLLFDVFQNHEPDHPLFKEAFLEVERVQLDFPRLKEVSQEMAKGKMIFQDIKKLSPFSFPLYAQRVSSRLSTEDLAVRIARLQKRYMQSSTK